MTRTYFRLTLLALTLLAVVTVSAQRNPQGGGAFSPGADYDLSGDLRITNPGTNSQSPVTLGATQTLTNKTLTSPTITGSTLSSPAITGTVTGGASYTAPTLTAVTITGTGTIANGMTITTPALSGTVTGTYTLGGTPTLASAAGVPYVGGVAASYRLARGAITLDGSNPSTAASGLTTIISCSIDGPAAAAIPGDDPLGAVPFINTTNLDVYAWKTDGTDPTPVASTNSSAVFYWVCIGT